MRTARCANSFAWFSLASAPYLDAAQRRLCTSAGGHAEIQPAQVARICSDFQLTLARVKKSGVATPRDDTWKMGPKVAVRRKRKMQEMGANKQRPIEL